MKINREFVFDAVILFGGYALITLVAVAAWFAIDATP